MQDIKPGAKPVLKKRISVSKKRQVTIPIDFFKEAGIEDEVECYLRGNTIIITPVHEDTGEFDEQILADLISEGFSGKELLSKFKEARKKVRPAIKELLREAGLVAQGKAPFATYEDVFGAGKNDEQIDHPPAGCPFPEKDKGQDT